MIFIKKTLSCDLKQIATNMRQAEIDEVLASGSQTPLEALEKSLAISKFCQTCFYYRENKMRPFMIFGIVETILSDVAQIWALSSNDIKKVNIREFLKHSKMVIEFYLSKYSMLFNYADVRHIKNTKWLQYLGATIYEPQTNRYGAKFFRFEFKRK